MGAGGLFAATGKVAKEKRARVPQDFYRTPAEVTQALLSVEGWRFDCFEDVWEPACGDGAIARELKEEKDWRVHISDIVDRGIDAEIKSFFDYTINSRPARAIVTNPPYSLTNWGSGGGRWVTYAVADLDIEYMALLLPWSWPAAKGLDLIWHYYPPARVYLLTWKVDWTGQGAPPQNNAWFVWDKAHQGDTTLHRLGKP